MASGADRLSNLPEGVLHHILSLLPAQDAVRTCVLAQSWRNHWRSAPALRIVSPPDSDGLDDAFGRFVDGLLLARRGGPPLDFCDFDLDAVYSDSDSISDQDAVDPESGGDFDLDLHGNDWIRRVLELMVRRVRLRVCSDTDYSFTIRPLSSQHLTSLELIDVNHCNEVLDFSGCPLLERIKMMGSYIWSRQMHSPSLKHLSIKYCHFYSPNRISMSLPSLISFKFIGNAGRAPMLERMPYLETAKGQFDILFSDRCENGRLDDCGDAGCQGCFDYYGPNSSGCVFLHGLTEATYLNLSAYPTMYVFNRDLKWCPPFNKLKTLVLSKWFLSTELSALIWFLHHTPLLEKLTLEIPMEHKSLMETKGSYNALEKSIAPNHLKNVEIICEDVGGIVLKVLKVLYANGIPLRKIQIQCPAFDFVCTGIKK